MSTMEGEIHKRSGRQYSFKMTKKLKIVKDHSNFNEAGMRKHFFGEL